MKDFVIITAGGTGTRFGGSVPKQFLILADKPVLAHSLCTFNKALPRANLFITLPENHISNWKHLSGSFTLPEHTIISGGKTRFQSVKNAIDQIDADLGRVWIHDGARPLLSNNLIKKLANATENGSAAVPAIQPSDSVRFSNNNQWKAFPREDTRLIQTPQVFPVSPLKKAYQQKSRESFTDDASVFEAAGFSLTFLTGEKDNIKITVPNDMLVAESILIHLRKKNPAGLQQNENK